MAQIALSVTGIDSTFTYVDGQTKYTEQLSWFLLRHLEEATTANALLFFVDETEEEAIDYDVTPYLIAFTAWLADVDAEIALAETQEREPNLPAPPEFPTVPAEPLWMQILKMAIKLGIQLLVEWLRNRKKHEKNKDASEVVDWFKQAFLRKIPDGQGGYYYYPILGKIEDERNVKVSINEDQVIFWPGAMSVDLEVE